MSRLCCYSGTFGNLGLWPWKVCSSKYDIALSAIYINIYTGSDLGGLFEKSTFAPTDPKIFVKAPLASICTYFEGERAPKKAIFCQNFPKSAQKRLF